MIYEQHDLHGTGAIDCEVYEVPSLPIDHPDRYWSAVTDIPCPVVGCGQRVLWYEAGYVPGYRVCAAAMPNTDASKPSYDITSIEHRFLARGNVERPILIRDHEGEQDARQYAAELRDEHELR